METLAVSTGVAIAYTVVLFVLLIIGPLVVTALKGQWLLFAAGWLAPGLVWTITALRLGRPGSWWARRFYGPRKMARAEDRYGPVSP
ncbi:MAG TPA: hypothetical protein VFB52_00830 [Solirubrobacterales bacterium]|nr:hypothetical protein [Solirubrobacterales bacterium]